MKKGMAENSERAITWSSNYDFRVKVLPVAKVIGNKLLKSMYD